MRSVRRWPIGRCTALVDGPQIVTDEISAIPDVVVTCAPIDLTTPVVALPVIIVEVMSPASEADDTGRKWLSYQKIPSLRHYLVLAQDRCLVQIHSRAATSGASASSAPARSSSTSLHSASTSPPSTPRPSLLRRRMLTRRTEEAATADGPLPAS